MTKRRCAADLVKNSGAPKARGINWYQRLSGDDQTYIYEVVKELAANPNAALYLVAKQLAFDLDINRSPQTIAKTLKKMVEYDQAKREKTSK